MSPSRCFWSSASWGLFVRLDTGRDRLLWIGLAAAFAALFVRQLALAVFLAFLIASPLRLGFGHRWLLYAMSPTLLAGISLAAYSRVLAHFGRLPGMYYLKVNSPGLTHHFSQRFQGSEPVQSTSTRFSTPPGGGDGGCSFLYFFSRP